MNTPLCGACNGAGWDENDEPCAQCDTTGVERKGSRRVRV